MWQKSQLSFLFNKVDPNFRLKSIDVIQLTFVGENTGISTSTLDRVEPRNDRFNISFGSITQ